MIKLNGVNVGATEEVTLTDRSFESQRLRAEIEEQTKAFLASGGKVTVLKTESRTHVRTDEYKKIAGVRDRINAANKKAAEVLAGGN